MVFGIVVSVYVLVCLFLILFVLIQSDKGGGLAGALGGMGGVNTIFGGRGTATIITKVTTGLALGYLVLSLMLNLLVSHSSTEQVKGVLQKRAEKMAKMAPASALPIQQDPSAVNIPQAPAPAGEQ